MYNLFVRGFCFLLVMMAITAAHAQIIDPAATFKTIHNKSYFRLYYDNDYFTKTDYYYSQGVTIEYVHQALKKLPVSKILLHPAASNVQYGIAYHIFAYTPTSIGSNEILYGDRPFAAAMSLQFFAVASDSLLRRRIASAVSIGIIGPAAQGE